MSSQFKETYFEITLGVRKVKTFLSMSNLELSQFIAVSL